MPYLTKLFGVTFSDADRNLAREAADIERSRRKVYCCRRIRQPNNTGLSLVELTQRVSAPVPNSKYLMLHKAAILY